MNKIHEWVNTLLIVVVAILVLVGGNNQETTFGGVSNFDSLGLSALKVGSGCNSSFGYSGCTATEITKVLNGTCNASQSAPGSHAATTSMQFYCAVAGVTADDKVFVSLPVGAGASASLAGGFVVNAAYATSSDFIGFSIMNNTGAATSSYRQATTSITYLVLD